MKARCICWCIFAGAFFSSPLAFAEPLHGRVVCVADGDTITVMDANFKLHKVRLAGIDAPESKQVFGDRSMERLARVVAGQVVSIEGDKLDRYQRRIGKVLFNGRDINLEQIRFGLAWHYKKFSKEQATADQAAYAQAEDQARSEHRGLWNEPSPVAPWDFRHDEGRTINNNGVSRNRPNFRHPNFSQATNSSISPLVWKGPSCSG